MAIIYAMRGPGGDIVRVASADHAAQVTAGYADIGPPWVELADDLGAWDTGPYYIIAHADGRRYAVTMDNFTNYYSPVGFTVIGLEIPAVAYTRVTEAGDTRTTAAGDTRITA